MSMSFNGAFLGGVASVEASFGYSTKSSSSSHLVSGYTYGTVQLPGAMLANLQKVNLTEDALELLTTDLNDFFDFYGTHYIRNRVYGCDSAASYTFTCSTQSAAEDIKASLQANYNGGAVSVGGKVSTAYSTYAASSICTYNGQTTASGLDTLSPSSAQMMNATLMDNYWNNLESNCRAADAANATKLLYVELGNWWDLPAVKHAVSQNSTAVSILKVMATVKGDDLTALAYASVYLNKLHNAVYNMPQALLSGSTPAFSTGFFDRTTGQGLYPVSSDYWTQLPAAHADIISRLSTITFSKYFNMRDIANNAQYYDATYYIKQYFQNIHQLYIDATNAYKYAYASVSATVLSFEADNTTPSSRTIVVKAGDACTITENIPGGLSGVCAANEDYHFDNVPLQFGIRSTPSGVTGTPMLSAFVRDAASFWQLYSDNNAGSVNNIDLTPAVHQICATCPRVRMDLGIQYVMPDITLNSAPVGY